MRSALSLEVAVQSLRASWQNDMALRSAASFSRFLPFSHLVQVLLRAMKESERQSWASMARSAVGLRPASMRLEQRLDALRSPLSHGSYGKACQRIMPMSSFQPLRSPGSASRPPCGRSDENACSTTRDELNFRTWKCRVQRKKLPCARAAKPHQRLSHSSDRIAVHPPKFSDRLMAWIESPHPRRKTLPKPQQTTPVNEVRQVWLHNGSPFTQMQQIPTPRASARWHALAPPAWRTPPRSPSCRWTWYQRGFHSSPPIRLGWGLGPGFRPHDASVPQRAGQRAVRSRFLAKGRGVIKLPHHQRQVALRVTRFQRFFLLAACFLMVPSAVTFSNFAATRAG